MPMSALDKAVEHAEEFRVEFVRRECRSFEDLLALAVALMQQAEIVFTNIGGSDMAAQQFYETADRCASQPLPDARH